METSANTATTQSQARYTNSRTAGSMPVWQRGNTAYSASAKTAEPAHKAASFDQYVSNYSAKPPSIADTTIQIDPPASEGDAFGFFDVIDMVNPLQHIPLVNIAYREITGDQIKPVSRIIGGGLFGGPAGAAMGVANAVIEQETGKDMAGAAVSLVRGDLHFKSNENAPIVYNNEDTVDMDAIAAQMADIEPGGDEAPSLPLNEEQAAYDDLPAALLGFALNPISATEALSETRIDYNAPEEPQNRREQTTQRKPMASGRTAGTIAVHS